MRIILSLLTVAAAAAAVTTWLLPVATENELAIVTGVGAGGMARIAVPVSSVPVREQTTESRGVVGTESANPRFFGFALPFTLNERRSTPAPQLTREPQPAQQWATEVVFDSKVAASQTSTAPLPVVSGKTAVVFVQPLSAAVPLQDKPRPEMVREIQQQLRRVGCYTGDVDGDWGVGSRRAMQAFMSRVNSSLNSDNPDLIQLTLVRGFAGVACAAPCPPERMVAGSATCLQGPMMATRPVVSPQRPEVREVRRATPASPAPSIVAGSTPTPTVAAVQPRVAVVPTGGVTTGSIEAPVALQSSVVPGAPLEGRMAIGGPAPVATEPLNSTPVSAAPATAAARASKPRSQGQPAGRSERNWTAGFFDR